MTVSRIARRKVQQNRMSNDVRTLLLGASCVVVLLLAGKGIPLLTASRRATASQLRMARVQLAEDRSIISSRAEVQAQLDATTTSFLGLSPAFLKGSSASQAAAELASLVSDAADANGVHLSSLQPGVDSTTRTLIVPVVVHASGTGDVRGISKMLSDLESGAPLVSVWQLTIAQADPAALPDRMEALHLDIAVRALYRRIPGSPDDKAVQ